jgi:hypothetical protein
MISTCVRVLYEQTVRTAREALVAGGVCDDRYKALIEGVRPGAYTRPIFQLNLSLSL